MVTVDPMTGYKMPFVKSELLKFSHFGQGDKIIKIRGDDKTTAEEFLVHTNGNNEFYATIVESIDSSSGKKCGLAIPLEAWGMNSKRKMRSFVVPDLKPFRGRRSKERLLIFGKFRPTHYKNIKGYNL